MSWSQMGLTPLRRLTENIELTSGFFAAASYGLCNLIQNHRGSLGSMAQIGVKERRQE